MDFRAIASAPSPGGAAGRCTARRRPDRPLSSLASCCPSIPLHHARALRIPPGWRLSRKAQLHSACVSCVATTLCGLSTADQGLQPHVSRHFRRFSRSHASLARRWCSSTRANRCCALNRSAEFTLDGLSLRLMQGTLTGLFDGLGGWLCAFGGVRWFVRLVEGAAREVDVARGCLSRVLRIAALWAGERVFLCSVY